MEFGKNTALQHCNTHIPFLNFEYIEYDDRNDSNVEYSNDEIYKTWDFLAVVEQDEVTMLIAESENGIGIKFYNDAIAYNGTESSDEYMDDIDLIPITDFNESLYRQILNDIKSGN